MSYDYHNAEHPQVDQSHGDTGLWKSIVSVCPVILCVTVLLGYIDRDRHLEKQSEIESTQKSQQKQIDEIRAKQSEQRGNR